VPGLAEAPVLVHASPVISQKYPLTVLLFTLFGTAWGCSGDSDDSASTEDAAVPTCAALDLTGLAAGSPDGHPDPFGAKAAGQARAGKLIDASRVKRPDNARNRIKNGDYVMANDTIALVIEGARESDGYNTFGGEITVLDRVAEDGTPLGRSQYGETLVAFSRQTIQPTSVTVLADGADGGNAIVRVSGTLANIPFLDAFRALYPREYGFPAAFDYVLAPHAASVTLRLTLVNSRAEPVAFENDQLVGFFQSSRAQTFTEIRGFASPKGDTSWVGYDGTTTSFGYRFKNSSLSFGVDISGFQYFIGKGLTLDACVPKTLDYAEFFPAAGDIDALMSVKRQIDGDGSYRELKGGVNEADGTPLGGALVHATLEDGTYLSRTTAAEDGSFTLHVPASPVLLTPTKSGFAVPAAVRIDASTNSASLNVPTHATLHVVTTDVSAGTPMPSRVQVIPTVAPTAPPATFGVLPEENGRLHQAFVAGGTVDLPVPAGDHRVIVSHGFEWSLFDATVNATSGATSNVDAALTHLVDTPGVMCADFHVHSNYSVDATDTPTLKVLASVADGLDIPVSSEHEWIINFQPIIESLGLTKWAYSFPSEELSTFAYGHFGVIPKYPDPNATNVGAVPWIGVTPQNLFASVNALPEKPVLIVNHPRSGGTSGAYFTASVFDPDTVSGNTLYSEGYGALEVMNDSDFESNRDDTVHDWFALLNGGKSIWAVGNSDSHKVRNGPVGYPRNCLAVGTDDPATLTAEHVRDVLRAGANTVSGGIYLDVKSPTGSGPGTTSTEGAYLVTIRAVPWVGVDSLEVIVDGESVQTILLTAKETAPAQRFEETIAVAPKSSRARHWVVFHVKGKGDLAPLYPKRNAFAVSNPIFF